jgi:hypothetical protein
LPLNSRNANAPQSIITASGALEIWRNKQFAFLGEVYQVVSDNGGPEGQGQIRFVDALPNDTEVIFRLDSLGGSNSFLSGGGDAWSDPVDAHIIPLTNNTYDLGSGSNKFKDGYFAGKLTVDGVIDPTGLDLVPQASNPLAPGRTGIWISNNAQKDFIVEHGGAETNITQKITALESGISVDVLTKLFTNVTGVTIPKHSVVYSPTPGNIALADGTDLAKSRVIGVTLADITTGSSGLVGYSGVITGVTGFTHGEYLFLDQVVGQLTETEPTLPGFPSGFKIRLIGIIEDTNLFLQITPLGVL